jgi:hypothetical protein
MPDDKNPNDNPVAKDPVPATKVSVPGTIKAAAELGSPVDISAPNPSSLTMPAEGAWVDISAEFSVPAKRPPVPKPAHRQGSGGGGFGPSA